MPVPETYRTHQHFYSIAVLLFLTLMTLLPVVRHPDRDLLMYHEATQYLPDGDPYQFFWNLWYVRGWISGDHPLFSTHMVHYPFGARLAYHTLSLANGLLSCVFPSSCPYPLQLNILIFFHTFFTAVGTYLLCRKLGAIGSAAIIGGVVAAFWPARLSHISNHLNVISTSWIPVFLFLIIFESKNRYLRVLGSGIILAILGVSGWHLFISVLLVSWIPLMEPGQISSRFLRTWIPSLIIGVLILWPMFRAITADEPLIPPRDDRERLRYSMRLPDFVTPDWLMDIYGTDSGNGGHKPIERYGYIGVITGLLGLTGLIFGRFRERLWFTAAGILMLLSLGPGTVEKPILILPYRFLVMLPGFGHERTPGRFLVTAGIFLAVGVALLLSRHRWFNKNKMVQGLMLTAVFLDLFPFTSASTILPVHPVFKTLPTPEKHYPAILNIPRFWGIRRYQFEQIFHRHPISSGFLARFSPEYFWRTSAVPLMSRLSSPDTAANALLAASETDLFDIVSLYKIQLITVHRMFCTEIRNDTWNRLIRKFERRNLYTDDQILIIQAGNSFPPPKVNRCRFYFWNHWFSEEKWDKVHGSVRWSAGTEASIVLFIPPKTGAVRFGFQVFVPTLSNEKEQSVSVIWNNRIIVKDHPVPGNRWTHIEGVLEPPFPSAGNPLLLKFSRSWIPADEGLSKTDARSLGGAVNDFSIDIVE